MIYIFIGLIIMLVLFLWSACALSSRFSREEDEKSAFYKNMKKMKK